MRYHKANAFGKKVEEHTFVNHVEFYLARLSFGQ